MQHLKLLLSVVDNEDIMNRYRIAQEKLPTLGAKIIDATGTIDETVKAVIEASKA